MSTIDISKIGAWRMGKSTSLARLGGDRRDEFQPLFMRFLPHLSALGLRGEVE